MSAERKVLVVEDDTDLRESLCALLSSQYTVISAVNGIEGTELAKSENPTVILLDIMMPKRDGYETVECLRTDPDTKGIPILMLTALSEVNDRVKAFRIGADDFIPKPFEPEELLARVASKVRMLDVLGEAFAKKAGRPKKDSFLRCGNLTLDPKSLEAWLDEQPVDLTLLEFNLVRYLIKHAGELRSRRQILDAVWKTAYTSERNLDPHIMLIRRKLAKFDHEIVAIYGGGYILKPLREPNSRKTEVESPSPARV